MFFLIYRPFFQSSYGLSNLSNSHFFFFFILTSLPNPYAIIFPIYLSNSHIFFSFFFQFSDAFPILICFFNPSFNSQCFITYIFNSQAPASILIWLSNLSFKSSCFFFLYRFSTLRRYSNPYMLFQSAYQSSYFFLFQLSHFSILTLWLFQSSLYAFPIHLSIIMRLLFQLSDFSSILTLWLLQSVFQILSFFQR